MGGGCPKVEIKEVELELGGTDSKRWWKSGLKDEEVTEGRMLAYSDGSMLEDGKGGMGKGGWVLPRGVQRRWGTQQLYGVGRLQGWWGQYRSLRRGRRSSCWLTRRRLSLQSKKQERPEKPGPGIWCAC